MQLSLTELYALAHRHRSSAADAAAPPAGPPDDGAAAPTAEVSQQLDLVFEGHPFRPDQTHGYQLFELADGGIMAVSLAGMSVVDRIELTGPGERRFVPAQSFDQGDWAAARRGTHFLRVDAEDSRGDSWVMLRDGAYALGGLALRPRDARDLAERLVAAATQLEARGREASGAPPTPFRSHM